MVKNIPTIERSTKIRFGKNCTEDQGENTIVFNASNVQIDATQPGAVYMTPIRKETRGGYPNYKMLIYNTVTKEIADSDVIADDILLFDLESAVINGNVTSNTVSFNGPGTSVTTLSNVGVANGAPIHTLDVGTKFYVDEEGANVLTVLGDTYIQDDVVIGGNLDVKGTLTSINTENTVIKDAIIEMGKGNVSSDMGIIMDRPGTNVTMGYREGVDEFVIAHTTSSATSSTITPSSELIDARVHGRLHVNSNLTVDTDTLHVDAIRDRVGINTLTPQTDLDVVGSAHVHSDFNVDTDTLFVDASTDRVGINTLTPSTDFHVEGSAYVSGNVTVDTDTFHVDTVNDRVGVNTSTPTTDFHVEGSAYVSGNVDVQTNLNVLTDAVITGNTDIQSELNVTGNTFISSNAVVTGNTDVQSELNVTGNAFISSNLNAQSELNVTGNAFMSSNVVVTGNVDVQENLNVLTDAVITGNTDVQSELNVTGNAFISSNLNAQSELNVTGNAFMSSNVVVTGNVDVQENLNVLTDAVITGNIDIQSELNVTGNAFISSNAVVTGNTDVQSELNVTGNAFVSSNLNAQSELNVTGNAFVSSNLNAQSELNVTGNAFMSSNVVVTGNTDVQSELNVTGNTFVSSNLNAQSELNVTGNAFVSSNVVVTGNTDVQSELNVTGNAFISSNVVVTGNTDVQSELNVTGNAFISSNLNAQSELNVTGNAFISSNVVVTGNVDVQTNLNVTGNAYATEYYGDGGLLSNVNLQVVSDHGNTTSNTIQFTNPTTAFTTDLTSNVEVKLDQLANVVINTTDVYESLRADHTLVYDGENWYNDYPKHTYVKIYNDSGGPLPQGSVVYIKGTHNANLLDVDLAKADSSTTMPAFGIVAETIAYQAEGVAVTYGKALTTSVTSFIEGETVYVSATTAGGLSNVKPYNTALIQNVGVVTKSGGGQGAIFVTGIGRANDIPNAPIVLDETDINYVYVNDQNNDLKKIEPSNLLTQLQTLQQVTDTSNTTSNIVRFTNATTGLVTTSNIEVGDRISIGNLSVDKIPIVGTGNFLENSAIGRSNGTIVISSDLEVLGNIVVDGNSYIVESNSLVINDRIIGIANNNVSHELDVGIIMQHPGKNIALIHHGETQGDSDPHDHTFTIGYTQNTVTDNHVFDDSNLITVEILGNLITQNNLTVSENITVVGTTLLQDSVGIANTAPVHDLDVGSNLYVDDQGSNVLHVTGNVYATRFVGDGAFLENIASNLHEITTNGNVTTNTLQFDGSTALVTTGKVGVSNTAPVHDLDVGSNLYVDDTGSNVLYVTGNVYATRFIGDGAFLENIASNLHEITTNGNVTTNTIQFDGSTALVTTGKVGVSNTAPVHDLDVGSNLYVDDQGSNVLHVTGNVYATRFVGDGAFLENIASNLHEITTNGNVTTNTIQFDGSTALVTTGKVGVANTAPIHDLDVGSNLYVDDQGSNVVHVTGNVYATRFVGDGAFLENIASNLHEITTNGNVTTNTVQFDGSTALITTGNVGIANAAPGHELSVTGNVYVSSEVNIVGGLITNLGGVAKKTYSHSNVITASTIRDIDIVFDSELFSAKITAHLVEPTSNISVLNLDVTGGTGRDIGKGFLSIVGDQNSKHWDSTVTTTDTTVTLAPSAGLLSDGNVHVFVEYTSPLGAGGVVSIDGTTFDY